MASYNIVKIPEGSLKTDDIEQDVGRLSARKSEKELKTGTMPETFEWVGEDMCWVKYARQKRYNEKTLEGIDQRKKIVETSVIFLRNGYLVIGKPSEWKKKWIRELLTELSEEFTDGFSLSTLEFDEETLESVIDESDSITGLDVKPTRKKKPKKISGRDQKLEDTDFLDEHEVDPFEKVKVQLPDKDINVDVSFDRKGTVILHTRNMSMQNQIPVLRYITDKIVDQYLEKTTFQSSLSGTGGDDQ